MRTSARPTLDVKAVRARFPIFERLVYVNSCSQGALSDAVRRSYEEYLRDWDDKGAPVGLLGRAHRGRAHRVRRPDQRRAGRDRRDDVEFGRCRRACERAPVRGSLEGRSHRHRVPDDRADLARAGGARRPRDPCAAGGARVGGRRGHADRLDDARLLPNGREGRSVPRSRASPTSRAHWCCSTPTRRSARCPST